MSRRLLNMCKDTKKHPAMVDIEVNCQDGSINFKHLIMVKLAKKLAVTKRKMEEEEERDSRREDREKHRNEQHDSDESLDEEESSDEDPEDKKPREQDSDECFEYEESSDEDPEDTKSRGLPGFLRARAKYCFISDKVVLCFYDEEFDWNLVGITGVYDFSQTKIDEGAFEEITGRDLVYRVTPSESAKAKVFKLDISKIDRHILMTQFIVNISYLFFDDVEMKIYNTKYSFELPYFQQKTTLNFKFLGHYYADKSIIKLYNHKFKYHRDLTQGDLQLLREIDEHQRRKPSKHITVNSTQIIKYALNIEDLNSQDEFKDFTLIDVRLRGSDDSYWFRAKRHQIPPNFKEVSLCLVSMGKYVRDHINAEDDCIFAQINDFKKGRIYFVKRFPWDHYTKTKRTIDRHISYSIRFIPNRITYRACFQALDMIRQRSLKSYFDDFEDEPEDNGELPDLFFYGFDDAPSDEPEYCTRDNGEKVDHFEWFNDQIGTNEEQMSAIKNIVNCTAYPFPYVVFGPPGAGKSSCIVECIAQILKSKPNSRIMVTAQSNSACDEVGVRLLKYISANKIFRFYSPSLLNPKNGDTSEVLRKISTLRDNRHQYPTLEEFCYFNVVIATLMSCSRLVQIDNLKINQTFDYIFVDECAAATEPEAFVPIIGLGTACHAITTNIVLLGDHKQLGPVISSDLAARLGLGVSLMERIMSKRRYQMNPTDKSFDSNYVTQLLDNFRSHPAILQFSNVLFYESKLRAKIQEPERSFGTKWNYLNNKKFPLLFHCVKTPSKVIKGGTSSFNEGEIKLVRFYIDLLLSGGIGGVKVEADDIGVVSPYKAQLSILRDELCHAPGVEIGTAEYYQGREKKIIIISTVKSGNNIGFLKSEKRLNVCITRAKSLLILIGNADTLQQDSLWNSFMHFAKANKACCGDDFTLQRLTAEEQKTLDELNSVFSQLSVDEDADAEPVVVRNEALEAIKDRMKKLEELVKEM